ncbi:carboxymuconolactone decarboxylase family protein [Hirschia baltica]|uniref:Carboxymuconolactone decarboxylase n=1 Tax=Hirschia baltica (strain ATCC 49814 / DSM 5838 / IFAM 1418) TaxID=582402 RepID=C6XL91_HIRBI|nr:carboxymuconolactone decarboxylase family protein [Hirschia baltica]ACT59690.1 Carboxymuconolactone decarboxylase [Hirschia baltica ATCC 49814]
MGISKTDNDNNRLARGMEAIGIVDGEAGNQVVEAMADIMPDFATQLIENFGDIYTRPQLNLREREIATIAALTAIGHAIPQLKVHIQAGLNVGLSEHEITEIMMQMHLYAGFPAAINAMFAAKEVFAAQKSSS